MKRAYLIILFVSSLIVSLSSCSTTRRIPDDETLYTGLKGVNVIAPDSVRFPEEVKAALRNAVNAPANKKTWFILPVGLWVYNNVSVTDSSGWLIRKIGKLAQDPILVSDIRPALRVKLLDEILDNNGYFRGAASYELVYSKKNHKKASILYNVSPGPSYPIDTIMMLPDTSALTHLIDSLAAVEHYLKPGTRFSMDSLNNARTQITNKLRNRGYYFFRPNYIEYLCDSLISPGKIALKIDLANNTPKFALDKYITGDITVNVHKHAGGGTPDTIPLQNLTIVQMMPSKLRKSVITDNVAFRPGRTFSVRSMNNTQTYLSRMGIFDAISINAIPDTSAAVPTLDVIIDATFDIPLEAQFELNASSKSNSYIGPGVSFGVTNHNIFGGGEQLNVNLKGSYEWQTGNGSRSIFNSYEVGLSGSLSFPRLLAPKFIPRRRRQLNWTRISLSGELMNRPHFFKLAQLDASISYDWNSTRHITNSFTLFKLTYNKLINTTEKFDSIMEANPAVALSFVSQFIPQMGYSLTYDKSLDYYNNINWQISAKEAGNIFWSIYELAGVKDEKKLFGTPFSQFIKGSTQLVWGRRIGEGDTWLVSRAAVGAAHAYGNSSTVPYSEQFYCGGANSVRAFTVRSIGPGSYHVPTEKGDYFDQTGTFKFEANVEYRFPIFGPLNGAVFLDAGNVWLLKKDPLRPGGELRGKTFFKDLATGTGAGLRFDIGMLVLRGDLGIGIHAPYDTGKSGYYNMKSFGRSLAFHLAIGYPF